MTTPLVEPFVDVGNLKSGAKFLDQLHQSRVDQMANSLPSTQSLGVANPYGDGVEAQEPGTLKYAESPGIAEAMGGTPTADLAGADGDTGATGLVSKYASAYNEQHKNDGDIQLTETSYINGQPVEGGAFNPNAVLSGLDAEQSANARLIAQAAISRGLGTRGALIGIMVAMTESSLRNLKGGDRDSAGLFQQRPSQGWGSFAQVTDPNYSINKFFDALSKKDYNSGDPWVVAQSVQRSGYADGSNFKKYYDQASAWVQSLFSGGGGQIGSGSNAAPPGSLAANVINAAKTMLGTYYVWGGTTSAGVDCSGLIYYALNKAGYKIPRYRAVDYGKRVGTTVSMGQARPGDLVYWDEPGDTDHVGIYLGNNQVIQAPTTGQKVKISSLSGWAPTSIRRILPDSAW